MRDTSGGSVIKTLELKGAYCVAHQEQFVHGDVRGRAYQCFLSLSDPDGWPRGLLTTPLGYGPVQLVRVMLAGDVLPAWAADPQEASGHPRRFPKGPRSQPLKTLRLPAAYCVAPSKNSLFLKGAFVK